MFYIYRIANLVNGKTYIGQHEYEKLDEYYMGSGVALKRAQKKYGIKNFKKDILVFNIPREEQANILEQTFIDAEREKVGRENCYNIADGGKRCVLKGEKNGMFGKTHSKEVKRKIAKANSGENNGMFGKPSPMKGKSPWNKDKRCVYTQETLKKISEAATERNRGKHWYNNGKINKFCYECPEGFELGKIKGVTK